MPIKVLAMIGRLPLFERRGTSSRSPVSGTMPSAGSGLSAQGYLGRIASGIKGCRPRRLAAKPVEFPETIDQRIGAPNGI